MILRAPVSVTLIFCFVAGAMNNPILIQSPPVITVVKGLTVQLWCAMYDACVSTTNVHWYQQRPGTKSTWVISLQPTPIWKRGFPHRFWPSREVARNIYLLTIRDVQPSDTALYTCGVRGAYPEAGTRLNVTSAPVIIQSPSLERVTEGQTARLQCTIQKTTVRDTDVHWYRQLPGQDMEWVLTHDVMNNTRGGPGFTDRFQPSRDIANNSFILTITNVQPNDTAVYYCKVWGDISGNGTQLNITSPLADPVLAQYPTVSKVPEGETIQLQCAMYNASVSDTDAHWYYQRPGNNSKWLMSHFVNGTITRSQGFPDRFQPSRNVTSNSYILTIMNVSLSDTAVYNCSVWSYIYGAGTQLNITKRSEKNWHIISIIAVCALVLIILLCILITVLFYVKRWACFQSRLKPEGTRTEDVNVDASVNVETRTNKQAAAISTASEEGEMYYADIQFLRQNTGGPTLIISEETTEYAAIKRA